MSSRVTSILVAFDAIWLSILGVTVLSPDLVTGSRQEHFPLAGLLAWISGAVATRSLMGVMARRSLPDRIRVGIAAATTLIWVGVVVLAVLGPQFVTGSDPTRIPVAAVLAPIGGAVATAFVGDLVRLLGNEGEPPPPGPRQA